MAVHCVVWGALLLVSLLLPGVSRWFALLFAAFFGIRLYLTLLLFSMDAQESLRVYDAGLYVKTEREERIIPWDQVEGFTGVLRRNPAPTAPRTTTGGASRSLGLRAGGRTLSLAWSSSGDLRAVVGLIEQRLLARQGQT
jgi:hypothetical protein